MGKAKRNRKQRRPRSQEFKALTRARTAGERRRVNLRLSQLEERAGGVSSVTRSRARRACSRA